MEITTEKFMDSDKIVVHLSRVCTSNAELLWVKERFDFLAGYIDLPEYDKIRASAKHHAEENTQLRTVLFSSGRWYGEGLGSGLGEDLLDLFKAIQDYYETYGYLPTDLIQHQLEPF